MAQRRSQIGFHTGHVRPRGELSREGGVRLDLDDELAAEWPAWRLVEAGWATIGELDRMSFDDVMKANDVLDAVTEARATPRP